MPIPMVVAHGAGVLVVSLAAISGIVWVVLCTAFYVAHLLVSHVKGDSDQRSVGLRSVISSCGIAMLTSVVLTAVWLDNGWTVLGRVDNDLLFLSALLFPSLAIGGIAFLGVEWHSRRNARAAEEAAEKLAGRRTSA